MSEVKAEPVVPQAPAEGTAPEGKAPPAEVPAKVPPAAEPPAEIAVKLPEGFKADEKTLGNFKQIAQKSGLKSEQAQAVLDFYLDAAKQAQAADAEAIKAYEKKNIEALKSDKEFGGTEYEANLETAKKAFVRFGSPELVKEFVELGLGSHPGLMKFALKVAKAISEDGASPRLSGGPAESGEDPLYVRYPTMRPK